METKDSPKETTTIDPLWGPTSCPSPLNKIVEPRLVQSPPSHNENTSFPPHDVDRSEKGNNEAHAADQAVMPGMEPGIKELYRDNAKFAWDDWSPDDVDIDPEESSDTKKYSLIVRREKSLEKESGLVLHSITVQSPLTRKLLGDVFDGYKGITTKLKDLTFSAPFYEFFYRWDRFQQRIKDEDDNLVLDHVALLQTIINAEIQPHIEKRQELLDNNLVTFEYLWALFEPGIIVYTLLDGQDRLFKLVDSKLQKRGDGVVFSLVCRYVDCDGSSFGYLTSSLTLSSFEGIKPVSELSVMPLHLQSRTRDVWEKLRKRGEVFESLNGFHYKSYSGLCIMRDEFLGSSKKLNIDDGRIVIDAKTWSIYNPDEARSLESLDAPLSDILPNEDNSLAFSFYRTGHRTIRVMGRDMQKHLNMRPQRTETQAINPTTLTEDQVILCPPVVRGYCLTNKQWVHFYIDNVRKVRWNVDAFHQLVLPHDYKEIVRAFVESQLSHKHSFDDIISGKGQGFIMLLSGEPGVGKTLTAEAVAEEMKKPLYSMTAGELGHTADKVEENLHRVLEISTKWGAVLLLDECDVFLEQRTISDIERNKLVSVFLRLLEYYKGVMFLTTNRVSAFDAAFQSRIHLMINYPKLDLRSKLLIWQTFVRPQSQSAQYASSIGEKDLNILAKIDMNGREIKNTVKTARLLSSRQGVPLAMEHVATVLRVKEGSFGVKKTSRSMALLLSLFLLPFRLFEILCLGPLRSVVLRISEKLMV